jgi:hypothetical protein
VRPCAKTYLRVAAALWELVPITTSSFRGSFCRRNLFWWVTKKSRAHEPFGSCALFQLSRKVFMLPGSICRENIPVPFSWQEVSRSFSVETCAPLCKSLPSVVAPPTFIPALCGAADLFRVFCLTSKRTSVRKCLTGWAGSFTRCGIKPCKFFAVPACSASLWPIFLGGPGVRRRAWPSQNAEQVFCIRRKSRQEGAGQTWRRTPAYRRDRLPNHRAPRGRARAAIRGKFSGHQG